MADTPETPSQKLSGSAPAANSEAHDPSATSLAKQAPDQIPAASPSKNITAVHGRRTIALALGSGGSRGYAHIGAIEILLERGYEIVAISGCSMGALVGGMYAAGKLKDYKDWVTGLGQFDVLKLLDVSLSSAGAIRGEKVFSVVRDMLGDQKIEDLPIPFTAVATDLMHHKEIWFQEGPLHRAIRASVAIPSLVTPVVMGNRVLVDGALLNPLPIMPTISSHADIVCAVNLTGEAEHHADEDDAEFFGQDEIEKKDDREEWIGVIREKATHWFDWDLLKAFGGKQEQSAQESSAAAAQGSDADDSTQLTKAGGTEAANAAAEGGVKGSAPKSVRKEAVQSAETVNWEKLGIGKFDMMNLTIEAMMDALVRYKLAGYPPDLLVDIPKDACRSYDYHKAPELIQIGRERMAAALDRFEARPHSHGPVIIR